MISKLCYHGVFVMEYYLQRSTAYEISVERDVGNMATVCHVCAECVPLRCEYYDPFVSME